MDLQQTLHGRLTPSSAEIRSLAPVSLFSRLLFQVQPENRRPRASATPVEASSCRRFARPLLRCRETCSQDDGESDVITEYPGGMILKRGEIIEKSFLLNKTKLC